MVVFDRDVAMEKEGEMPDARLARILKPIANCVQEGIEMEEDHPSQNEDGKMPILDMTVWKGPDNFILYKHYQKKMASKKVLHAESAQACKKSVHVQEILRRILRGAFKIKKPAKLRKFSQPGGGVKKFLG